MSNKLHKGGYWRYLFITTRVEIHPPKYFVSSASCQNHQQLKLDDKVKAINRCDGGKSCWTVAV